MNNELLVCILKKSQLRFFFYHKEKSAFAGSKGIYVGSNIFHFQSQMCFYEPFPPAFLY